MKKPSSTWATPEYKVKFTWFSGGKPNDYLPYTQVYGVCFDKRGDILIHGINGNWGLPGGTVEKNESPIATLKRELLEEADVAIKNPVFLGAQSVEVLNGVITGRKKGNDVFYQLRYYCEAVNILPQTPDPDNDIVHDRLFVDPKDITKYFNWKETGAALINEALDIYSKLHH